MYAATADSIEMRGYRDSGDSLLTTRGDRRAPPLLGEAGEVTQPLRRRRQAGAFCLAPNPIVDMRAAGYLPVFARYFYIALAAHCHFGNRADRPRKRQTYGSEQIDDRIVGKWSANTDDNMGNWYVWTYEDGLISQRVHSSISLDNSNLHHSVLHHPNLYKYPSPSQGKFI